jgi:hypothetical protein
VHRLLVIFPFREDIPHGECAPGDENHSGAIRGDRLILGRCGKRETTQTDNEAESNKFSIVQVTWQQSEANVIDVWHGTFPPLSCKSDSSCRTASQRLTAETRGHSEDQLNRLDDAGGLRPNLSGASHRSKRLAESDTNPAGKDRVATAERRPHWHVGRPFLVRRLLAIGASLQNGRGSLQLRCSSDFNQ